MGRNWTSPMKWDNQGSEPSESLKTSGFSGGYKPPAAVFNYLFNKVKTWITELQNAVDEVESNAFTQDDAEEIETELEKKKSLDIPQTSTVTVSSDNKVDLDSYTSPTEIYFVTSDINGLHACLSNSPNNLSMSCLFRVEKVSSETLDGVMVCRQTIHDGAGVTYVRTYNYFADVDNPATFTQEFGAWNVKVDQLSSTYAKASFVLNQGNGNSTTGNYAIVGGVWNTAYDRQTVFGKYADTSSTTDMGGVASNSATTGSLLTVGNGTGSSSRTNVLRVSASGKCYGSTSFGGSGAGLAEYWEWADGNPNNEDRRGHFVTLDGDKIRIATPDDSYILGVIDPCPFIVGDIQSESWKDMYLKDVFGEKKTETVKVPESVDENTGETIPEHTETRFIINPEYDNSNGYISREDRPEWDSITQHGKVVMIDDGTCEVNKYCTVGNGGIATASEDNYKVRVLKRIDDTHIQVFIDGVFVKQ